MTIQKALEGKQKGSSPSPKSKRKKKQKSDELRPAEMGQILSKQDQWIHVHEKLWLYQDGVYTPTGEKIARKRIQIMLGKRATKRFADETLYWLKNQHDTDPDKVDSDPLINVRNGLLDPATGTLRPHSPDVLSTVQLPVEWNPDVYHERGDHFLDEVLPDRETRSILEEAIGYTLLPDCRFEKAIMLTGVGANGKSVLLSWLSSTLGRDNASSVKLQELGHRFRTAQILGKMANIFADLPQAAIKESGDFKMLVSGDELTGEWKHKAPFKFRNRAKLWFSANELPRSHDRTEAFWRRWIVVPFPQSFPEGDPRRDPTLRKKLSSPEACSYLLRLAVEGLQRLLERGHFLQSKATLRALGEYRRESDTVLAFLDDSTTARGGAVIGKQELYDAYRTWCESNGLPRPATKITFGKQIRSLRRDVQHSKRKIHGRPNISCWVHLALLSPVSDDTPTTLHRREERGSLRDGSGITPGSESRTVTDECGDTHSLRGGSNFPCESDKVGEEEDRQEKSFPESESVSNSFSDPSRSLCVGPMDRGSVTAPHPGVSPESSRSPSSPVGNVGAGRNGSGPPQASTSDSGLD